MSDRIRNDNQNREHVNRVNREIALALKTQYTLWVIGQVRMIHQAEHESAPTFWRVLLSLIHRPTRQALVKGRQI